MDPTPSGRRGAQDGEPRRRRMVSPWPGRVGIENTKFKAIAFRVIAGLALRAWTGCPVTRARQRVRVQLIHDVKNRATGARSFVRRSRWNIIRTLRLEIKPDLCAGCW